MGLSEILEVIRGVLQFPETILKFIRLLRKTPQDNHETLLIKISEESKKFEDTGRPTWE